ncbi:hypothetical protein [Micromonospora sp. NPDC002575]|uniref:hypothetical protein n=1 Tax=Micromonospora sp. NPDC002575 TaxID=3364222 RepID=UPI003678E535
MQARAAGAVGGDPPALRGLKRETRHPVRYEPRGDQAAWQAAQERMGGGGCASRCS